MSSELQAVGICHICIDSRSSSARPDGEVEHRLASLGRGMNGALAGGEARGAAVAIAARRDKTRHAVPP